MLMPRATYLRYRGLDYIGRLCVPAMLGERPYLKFVESMYGTLPFDPEAVLIYKGGCCVSQKPESIKIESPEPPVRTARLASYAESLKRFYAERMSLTQAERLERGRALAAERLRINGGCKGCKKKMRGLEDQIVAVERAARREAGVGAEDGVESGIDSDGVSA